MENSLSDTSEGQKQAAKQNRRHRSPVIYVAGGVAALILILGARTFLFGPLARVYTFDVPWASSLAWSPDSSMLAIAGKTLAVYDITAGKKLLDYNPDFVQSVAWSPNGSILAAGIEGGKIVIWDVSNVRQTGQLTPLRSFEAYAEAAWDLEWSPDGKLLASIPDNEESLVIIWDAATGQSVWRYKDTGLGYKVAWSPDGSTVAATATSGISLLDIKQQDWKETLPHTDYPYASGIIEDIDWSPDGHKIVYGYWGWGFSGGMAIVDVDTGKIDTSFGTQRMVEKVDWSPKRNLIALGTNHDFLWLDYGLLYVYDTTTKERRWVPFSTASIEHIQWSPDGSMLAVSSFYQDKVTIWRLTPWAGGEIASH